MAGEQQRQGPAVRAARDPHSRVTRAVLHHLAAPGEDVQHPARVGHLEVGGVEMHEPPAGAEAARRVREHHVALLSQLAGVVGEVVLAPAETVGEQHRRQRPGEIRQVERGVEGDRRAAGLGDAGHAQDLGPDGGLALGQRHRGDRGEHQHEDGADDGQGAPGQRHSGSVTSATCAFRATTAASASTATATPWAPAPTVTRRPRRRSSAMTGHAVDAPNGVIVPRS